MKRFLCFHYPQWEAAGGMNDLCGQFDVLSEAIDFLSTKEPECFDDHEAHVYDIETQQIVWEA